MDKNWSRVGITDLNHLHEKIKKHELSKSHLQASTELALLGQVNIAQQLSSAYRLEIAKHNENVRKNRHILSRLISCVKFCGVFELALRGHDETEDSLNRGIFKELINFSAELDNVLKEHLENSSVFKGTSKTIQNDILDCMLTVCKNEILKEVEVADFLAIQCDETTDVSNHCQMAIILRYVKEHSIREHFWTFLRVHDKTANGLVNSIQQEIDPMLKNNKNKLIAQAYDGANVMSGSVGGVQAKMREKYPFAYFVHCYAHQLNLIMQKAASQNTQVRVFFSDLSGIPAFFSNSSHRSDMLEQIVKVRLPRVAPTRWNFNSRIVNTVYENRENLILCFHEISEKTEKTITSREASALIRTLEDSQFMFWLTLFHKIFPHVDVLYNQFQSRHADGIQLQKSISNFETSILSIRHETDAIEQEWITENIGKRRRLGDTDRKSVTAKEICDVIVTQLKDRLSYRGHLEANYLLTNTSYASFNNKFPNDIFNRVTKLYPMLSKERLKTELEVIYSRNDFSQINSSTSTLQFILKSELDSTFSELVKLLKIIMTTPMNTAEPERCFSTLKRLKTFLRNSMTNDRLNALAMMSINRDFVHEIPNFDEKVLETFVALKNRRMDFLFKE